jgi:hypothetical protein
VRHACDPGQIAIGGMYVLSNPEKLDASRNWMIGRHLAH